jgi:hypothetical protein
VDAEYHQLPRGADGSVALWIAAQQDGSVALLTRRHPALVSRSAIAGFRFPAEVITVAVRRYLRLGLTNGLTDCESLRAA